MIRAIFNFLLVVSLVIVCVGGSSAQTFTFECYGGYLTGADCQICTGQTQARLFNGLIVRQGSNVLRLIDCPYYIRQQGNNLVITELIPNPESVTINLFGTGFSTITGFRDSIACMCARQDSSWIGGGGSSFYQTFKDDGSSLTQQPNANFLQSDDINLILTNDGANSETEITADILANAVNYAEIQQVAANRLLGNPTGSTANVAEIPLATGLFFSGGNLNVADRDSLNEAWTIDGDDADSEVISNQVVKFQGAGINATDYNPATNTLLITGTEVDGSVANEGILGVSAGGSNDALLISNTSTAVGVTISGSNTIKVTESTSANGGTITMQADTSILATVNDIRNGTDTLENLAALRAYSLTAMCIWVQSVEGYFCRAGGGTENGGTLISALNGVKWKRTGVGHTYFPEMWEVGGYDENGTPGGIADVTEQIQAAVNVCGGTGGQVVLRARFSPYNVVGKVPNIVYPSTQKGAVELRSNMKFVIEQGCVLRKADGAQTDAGGSVTLIYADTISNITITGGGAIDGNTAGQPGWTGGYSQVGANGAGIFIAATNSTIGQVNNRIFVSDLDIYDHFSLATQVKNADNVEFRNIRFWAVGEGIEFSQCHELKAYNIYGDGASEVSVGDGFETSGCIGVIADGINLQNWPTGSAIDVYSSKNVIISNFIIKNTTVDGNGFGSGGSSDTTYADNLLFVGGYVYNCEIGGLQADGYSRYQDITFDSCVIGILSVTGTRPSSYVNTFEIADCTFKNGHTDGDGIVMQGRRPMTVKSCSFFDLRNGVRVSGSATNLTPNLNVTGCVFTGMSQWGINFDAQGQSAFEPLAIIEGNTFKDNTMPGITLPARTQKIVLVGNAIDTMLRLGGTFNEVTTGRLYVIDASPSTTTELPKSGEEHVVTIMSPNLTLSSSIKTIQHYTVAGGSANIALANGDAFVFERGATLTLKYNAEKNRWYEIARVHTGAFADSTYAIGERKIFADGWNVENVGLGSQSNIVVYRFNGLNTEDQFFYLPAYGMVRSIGVRSSTAISTGSITAGLWWDNTGPNGTVSLSGGQTINKTTYARYGKYPASTNTKYQMKYSTSSDFAHPTADISMWIEIEF